MNILEQLKDLEHRKGLFTKEEFETKFKEITDTATDEEILQAAKEAKETLGRGYNIDTFRRKIYSAVIVRYGHKPLKGSYMPSKTRSLLKKLNLYIPRYEFEKSDNKPLIKTLEEIKEEVSKEFGYKSFDEYIDLAHKRYDHITPNLISEVAKRYATKVAQASLEKAAEFVSRNYNDSYECKQDILNPKNITLL
ncbi:hypothetical protein [Elizabethkingia miricola]|uniref:hypothetical protein n=1 Tax=Elizabethkingia miricola TaxID=172045 RepID=UPI000999F7AC|nr:hypothetical protein [Elizabethkingia miricola]OPC34581.1 hypothetical protein BAX99_06860 [Elizabethkingia miricola]